VAEKSASLTREFLFQRRRKRKEIGEVCILRILETVTLSSKFQIVIPQKIRDSVGFHPGEKLKIIGYDGRVELVPEQSMKNFRGIASNVSASFVRDEDRIL
jgi:AbrB family looped-hinge helix DNA binding protein